MTYSNRIILAIVLSLVAHSAFLIFGGFHQAPVELGLAAETSEPLVVALNPPEERMTRRLIQPGAPAEQPVQESDLVSSEDSQAQDESENDGGLQPDVDQPADFDQLALPESQPAPPPAPVPTAPPVEQPPAEETPETTEDAPVEELAAIEPEEPLTQPDQEARPRPSPPVEQHEAISDQSFAEPAPPPTEPERAAEPAEERPEAEPAPERFDVARNTEPTPPRTEDVGVVRGRESEGAERDGPLSFEANRHALGDYMLEVRRKVERTWRTSLQFRYSGSTRVYALLECTISPEGHVVDVKILDRGESFVYAALCKQAIEQAGPFGPFPFDIPAAHRDENLVIRWRFTYM